MVQYEKSIEKNLDISNVLQSLHFLSTLQWYTKDDVTESD